MTNNTPPVTGLSTTVLVNTNKLNENATPTVESSLDLTTLVQSDEKKKKKKKDGIRLNCIQIANAITQVLANTQDASSDELIKALPKIDHEFKTFNDNDGKGILLAKVVDRTAIDIDLKSVRSAVGEYIKSLSPLLQEALGGSLAGINAGVDNWAYGLKYFEKVPKPWALKDDPELTYSRLSYQPKSCSWTELQEVVPIFTDIVDRIEDGGGKLLCQWIGSIFSPYSDRRQAIWLEGPPNAGKSLLTEIIGELLEPDMSMVLASNELATPFLLGTIERKRLIVVDDATPAFLNTNLFKTITGTGGKQAVNQKFKIQRMGIMDCKIILTSKDPLMLRRDEGIMSRVLRLLIARREKSKGVNKSSALVRQAMAPYVPMIAGYCIDLYKGKYPDGGELIPTNNLVEEAVSNSEQDFADTLEENFIIGPQFKITTSEFREVLSSVGITSLKQRRDFVAYLKRKHPTIKTNTTLRMTKKTIPTKGLVGIGILTS